ncbi:hypothetical protein IVA80_10380 [Bradyrhizobium sp. 139]|nr:hypothetical protein [Bradyrhizobium sp. 139]MCK1741263.1 hypothetical protein [Bradyrhizobium sp. 139]
MFHSIRISKSDGQLVAGATWSTTAPNPVGDYDGLLEQVGTQDWQRGGMA